MVDKSEKFSLLVRLGYAARGLLYMVIGYLALSSSNRDKSQRGAMEYVQDMPGGTPLLYLIAAGLLGYALFKFCDCVFDIEHHGGEPKALAIRAAKGGGAVIYAALAWSAFQMARGDRQAASSGSEVQEASNTLLTFGFGPLVLGLIGAGFVGAAIAQLVQAVTAKFMERVSGRAPESVEWVGRAGYAARAAVFAIVGWSLMRSAWWNQGVEIKSLGDAVDAMADNGSAYTALGIGLLMFGLFSLALSRYRIIPDIARSDLKPHLA